MVRRHELTNAQWRAIEPLMPANGRPSGHTGVPWPDLPERYGPWQTVYERHRRWSANGTRQRILAELQIEADADDPDGALARELEREWAVNIDSSSCRAHQHAAGARHRPPRDFPEKGAGGVWRPMGGRHWDAREAD